MEKNIKKEISPTEKEIIKCALEFYHKVWGLAVKDVMRITLNVSNKETEKVVYGQEYIVVRLK